MSNPRILTPADARTTAQQKMHLAEISNSSREAVPRLNEENWVDLDTAVFTIRALLAKAEEHSIYALKAFRDVGSLLLDIKAQHPKGKFARWIKSSFSFSNRTAQRYMRIAREWPRIEREIAAGVWSDFSLRSIDRFLQGNNPANDDDRSICQPDTDRFVKRATRLINQFVALAKESHEEDASSCGTVSDSEMLRLQLIRKFLQHAESCAKELNGIESLPPVRSEHTTAKFTSNHGIDSTLEASLASANPPSNLPRVQEQVTRRKGRGPGASRRPAIESPNPTFRC